jgi:hypothetical protein
MPRKGVLSALEKAFNTSIAPADRNALVHQIAGVVDPAVKQRQPVSA